MSVAKLNYTLPKQFVWSIHIIIGIFFIVLGSLCIVYNETESKENKEKLIVLNNFIYISVLILGTLMLLYHAHLYAKFVHVL